MLQNEPKFPFPGSTAIYAGQNFRVLRHHADGTALLSEQGTTRASGQRTVPIVDLLDPKIAEENASLAFRDEEAATARIALHTARILRTVNQVALRDLGLNLRAAAHQGHVPLFRDNSHLVRIMRKLGWKKDGYTGEGYERSPLYRRVADAQA